VSSISLALAAERKKKKRRMRKKETTAQECLLPPTPRYGAGEERRGRDKLERKIKKKGGYTNYFSD